MEKFKRVFKGLFKRSSKDKTTQETPPWATAPSADRSASGAPQLPPIGNTPRPIDFNQTAVSSAQISPTTQPAKPIHAASQAPPAQPTFSGSSENAAIATPQKTEIETDQARSQGGLSIANVQKVSHESTKTEEPDRGPVLPPIKADSFEPLATEKQEARTREEPAVSHQTAEQDVTQTKENIQPAQPAVNGDKSTPTTTAVADPLPVVSAPQANDTSRPTSSEEKMVVSDEPPPPIAQKQFAPGMSATSGPLEDFPSSGEIEQF